MTMQEMATAVLEGAPVKVAILNNGYLGMVRQWQQLFFEGRYSGTPLLGPDFARVAEAYDQRELDCPVDHALLSTVRDDERKHLGSCDLLARWLPPQGEMPGGVITAMIGAPLFIMLLRRSKR